MYKNAYFWKNVKDRLSRRGQSPRTPVFLLLTTIATLSSSFIAQNAVYYP